MKIFSDYDSSVNNLIQSWVGWMNETQDLNYKVSDVTSYDWVVEVGQKHNFDSFAFFTKAGAPYIVGEEHSCTALPNAVSFVDSLKERGEFAILTATHDDILIPQKNKHIAHYFGEKTEAIHEKNKSLFAITNGEKNILIDDNPYMCMAWALSGGKAVLFTNENEYTYALAPRYSHPNLQIADSYNEAILLVDKLMSTESLNVVKYETEIDKENTLHTWDIETDAKEKVATMTFKECNTLGSEHIHLEHLNVDGEYRNQGIGTRLLSLLAEAPSLEEKGIYLDVLYELPVSLYKRAGFSFDSPQTMGRNSEESIKEDFLESTKGKYPVEKEAEKLQKTKKKLSKKSGHKKP